MRYLLDPVQTSDVVQRVDARAEAAMKTEDLVLNEGGKGEVVEEVGEIFPNVRIAIFTQAFVIEAIDLCDLTRLMVSSENGDALWVSDF